MIQTQTRTKSWWERTTTHVATWLIVGVGLADIGAGAKAALLASFAAALLLVGQVIDRDGFWTRTARVEGATIAFAACIFWIWGETRYDFVGLGRTVGIMLGAVTIGGIIGWVVFPDPNRPNAPNSVIGRLIELATTLAIAIAFSSLVLRW